MESDATPVYTTTSDASSATSAESARQKSTKLTTPKDPMSRKLHWSFMEARIELMREKANLIREQVLTQKEITHGQLLKNRLMVLEIEKIEEDREKEKTQPRSFSGRLENVSIDPGIQREEPPDKRPRRMASRGSAAAPTTSTVTIATVQGPPPNLGHLRSAIQQAQSSSARSSATPKEIIQSIRESSVVSDINPVIESIDFYDASATGSQLYGQDSMDSTGYELGEGTAITKIEPADEFGIEYGSAGTSTEYVAQQYLQNLSYGSTTTSSAGPSVPNASMDMDAHTWKVTQFEPFLNQTPAGAELVQVLAQGVSLTEKQRICLVRMLSGYLRNVCRNPARGPDVPERKQCVDMLFDAYPQLGIDSNKKLWHHSSHTGWLDIRVRNETATLRRREARQILE